MTTLAGAATHDGTSRFRDRHRGHGHFRNAAGLVLSSLGIGTARGASSDEVDAEIGAIVAGAIAGGLNVLDTSRNYRDGRSERVIGAAIAAAVAAGVAARAELVIGSKAGYLPLASGSERWRAAAYLHAIDCDGALDEVESGNHCLAPDFVAAQLAITRAALGVATVDVYYLHNPEVQLDAVDRATFRARMTRAFEVLEARCAAGDIARYGVATWDGLRLPPDHPNHLDLGELCDLARAAAGGDHHLAMVQAPLSLAMPELLIATQRLGDREVPLLTAAAARGLAVIASAAAGAGQPMAALHEAVAPLVARDGDDEVTCSLQLVRSVPEVACALVGTRDPAHLADIVALAGRPPSAIDELLAALRS